MTNTKNWILLRGLARGRGHWGSFAQKFRERFPNDKIEFLDLPGNGERNNVKSPMQISDFVKDLRAQSQFVKNGESFQIVAVSLGAMIAVEWMREYPHEVQKAFIVCTSSSNMSAFYERYMWNNYLPTLKLLTVVRDPESAERGILQMVTNSHDRREAELKALTEYTTQHPVSPRNVLNQLIAAARYKFPAQAPGDIHVIGSFGDKLVSPNCSLSIANHWGLKPTMHSWAGHDLPIDDPQWLLEHLL